MSRYCVKDPQELFFVRGHAVVSDYEIIGITQPLDDETAYHDYGHRHLVAECVTKKLAEVIARALGKELK